jgi:hypothetical protein
MRFEVLKTQVREDAQCHDQEHEDPQPHRDSDRNHAG